ncbi:MAG: CPBP family intramembrane metalloprotease [Acetatifactor sp.]|nr:CPBP family intramembrane metalloprotease [Acetatifactor sp.]
MDGMNEMQGTYETGSAMWNDYMQSGRPNPGEDIKTTRKHFSKLGLMYFLGTLIIFGVQYLVGYLVDLIKPEWLENPNINLTLSMMSMYLVGIPIMVVLIRLVPAERIEQRHMKGGHFAIAAIMSYALMIVSNVVGLVITLVISLLKGALVNNELAEMTQSVSIPLLFVFTVFCAPFIEEFVFRKLLVDRTIRYGQGVSIIVSGLMFGLFHGNLNQFAYAFSLGMFLAFLYCKTGKLKVTIGIHMIVNFMGTIASALVLNGFDINEMQEALLNDDYYALMEFYSKNFFPMILMASFSICVFGIVIAGLVLFIIALVKRRFTFAPGQVSIPKGKRFLTVFLNVGMLLFSIFWIIQIVQQLLSI